MCPTPSVASVGKGAVGAPTHNADPEGRRYALNR
jgi:hypothetical protein